MKSKKQNIYEYKKSTVGLFRAHLYYCICCIYKILMGLQIYFLISLLCIYNGLIWICSTMHRLHYSILQSKHSSWMLLQHDDRTINNTRQMHSVRWYHRTLCWEGVDIQSLRFDWKRYLGELIFDRTNLHPRQFNQWRQRR